MNLEHLSWMFLSVATGNDVVQTITEVFKLLAKCK